MAREMQKSSDRDKVWWRRFLGEGSTSVQERRYLTELAQKIDARLVGEVGFNAGFSSYALLAKNSETRVVSFDIGEHLYVKPAKLLIDFLFPGRHTLIYGDSKETLPKFYQENPDIRFDLVFIDGGHDYETAKSDLINLKSLCTEKTVVVMDDISPWLQWGKGPARAWSEALAENIVLEEELFQDGRRVDIIQPPGKRSWVRGRFVFHPM